ncbi:peptidoglycan bridge formation glycyltransferase FemA/FemB family protein, partial [Streptococcus orisratti]
MALEILTPESFQTFCEKVQTKSFMQSLEMAELLSRRGCKVTYLGLRHGGNIQVAGVLYSLPMTGGLHMEINSGPASLDQKYLGQFYQELQNYAKTNGALELIVKPYDTYQTFDTKGEPVSGEHTELIQTLTKLGFSHDGLLTGYPGGEPDWHYVKDLSGLTPDTLRKSFSKKGRPLANKTASFGIKIRKLKRDELHLFKEITAATSERREYTDKSLDYYQDFYD